MATGKCVCGRPHGQSNTLGSRNVHAALTSAETFLFSGRGDRMLFVDALFAGRRIMRRLRSFGLLAALVLASSSAAAFQEQQAGGAGASTNPTPGIIVDNSKKSVGGDATVDMNFRAPPKDAKGGAEVFIPGLGRLGVLPSLDFGLELLYGANDSPDKAPDPNDLPLSDDELTIRGIVKHRF
jgi:hypothetical protein